MANLFEQQNSNPQSSLFANKQSAQRGAVGVPQYQPRAQKPPGERPNQRYQGPPRNPWGGMPRGFNDGIPAPEEFGQSNDGRPMPRQDRPQDTGFGPGEFQGMPIGPVGWRNPPPPPPEGGGPPDRPMPIPSPKDRGFFPPPQDTGFGPGEFQGMPRPMPLPALGKGGFDPAAPKDYGAMGFAQPVQQPAPMTAWPSKWKGSPSLFEAPATAQGIDPSLLRYLQMP